MSFVSLRVKDALYIQLAQDTAHNVQTHVLVVGCAYEH